MTEHMPHMESNGAKSRTVTKHVSILGLPDGPGFSDQTRDVHFSVDVEEPVLSGDAKFAGGSTEAFPGVSVSPNFDINKRAGTKSEFADQKASVIGGQAVEDDAAFPGVQRQESTPISTRAEAKQRQYQTKHGEHQPRHKAETTSFTAEQLQAARERLRRVLGTVAVVKDEVLDSQELHAGDNGDNEIYVGRHRMQGESRSERKNSRTNRIKRGAYRLAEVFDKKLHDYYEGNIPEYQPAASDDTSEASAVAETSILRRTAMEGDEVMFGGNKWTVEIIDEDEATIQRENEAGELEIEAISREDLNRLPVTSAPEADDTPELDAEFDEEDESDAEYRSKLQKLRDLPLLLAAKMATRRQMRNEALTEEQKDDRSRRRKLVALGAVVVGGILAVKYGHDHIWTSANDAATAGGGNKLGHLPLNNGGGDKVHNATEFFEGSKGSTHFSHEGVVDVSGWIDGHKVTKGESVWKLSKQYLIEHGDKHPSNYQIDAVKDEMTKVLKSKGLVDRKGWLKSGDIIKLK